MRGLMVSIRRYLGYLNKAPSIVRGLYTEPKVRIRLPLNTQVHILELPGTFGCVVQSVCMLRTTWLQKPNFSLKARDRPKGS